MPAIELLLVDVQSPLKASDFLVEQCIYQFPFKL